MPSPTYFPVNYFGGSPSSGGGGPLSTGGRRFRFVELYADRLDYELGTNDSNVLFTTARRKASINEGLREFADLTECWVRASTIVCSNAVALYNLHSTVNVPGEDFLRLTGDGPTFLHIDVSSNYSYLSGAEFPRRDEAWLNTHEPGWQVSTGVVYPMAWYLSAQDGQLSLGIYPPPSVGSSEGSYVLLPYIARPSSLVDDTSVPFTDGDGYTRTDLQPFHQAVVHYAAHRLELLRKDTQASDRQLQKFLGYVQRFVQAQRKKGGESVRPARSYFSRASRRADGEFGLRSPWWR